MNKYFLVTFAMALLLSGCSTAGPFVTNISSDGAGGLTIEKCMVHLNAFMGVVSNSDCLNTSIHLTRGGSYADDEPRREAPKPKQPQGVFDPGLR